MVRYKIPADNAESEGEFGHGLALLFAGFCLELNFLFQQRRCCNSNTYLHLKVVAVVKKATPLPATCGWAWNRLLKRQVDTPTHIRPSSKANFKNPPHAQPYDVLMAHKRKNQ